MELNEFKLKIMLLGFIELSPSLHHPDFEWFKLNSIELAFEDNRTICQCNFKIYQEHELDYLLEKIIEQLDKDDNTRV